MAKRLGKIVVKIHRTKLDKNTNRSYLLPKDRKRAEPAWDPKHEQQKITEISEKALKGKALSLGTQ